MHSHHVSERPPVRAQRAGGAGPPIQRHAAVAGALPCLSEPELYFADDPQDLRRAKALCRRCPVRSACLAGALQRGEPCGVWGGELLLNGAVIADKRPRGRPRKAAMAAMAA